MPAMIRSFLLLCCLAGGGSPSTSAAATELLNVSYDVSREVYNEVNPAFTSTAAVAGVRVKQSHGGSAKQARAVIDGLAADIVTMNSASDIDKIATAGLIPSDWASMLPNQSAPSYSAQLFLVRMNNPKSIKDWGDLSRPGIQVVMVNPKIGANGKYSYLSALAWARRQPGANDKQAKAFLRTQFSNVLALESGGNAASTSFAQRGLGDVLISFESEVLRLEREFPVQFQHIVPSISVRADNPVAVVAMNADRKGTATTAKAYLDFLYTNVAQEIFAKHFIRPVSETVLARNSVTFAKLTLVTIEAGFGGWAVVQKQHFDPGGWFDQLYQSR